MDIAVVGLGKLGSPLAAVLASKGRTVIGVDATRSLLITTHDPLLALIGDRRIALHNGRSAAPIVTSEAETRNLRQPGARGPATLRARELVRGHDWMTEWTSSQAAPFWNNGDGA